MSYNHDREGQPEVERFAEWAQEGNRGALNSPQAAGMMVLYYDHDKLATRDETSQVWLLPADTTGMWDETGRPKQPLCSATRTETCTTGRLAGGWIRPCGARRASGTGPKIPRASTDSSVRIPGP